MSADPGASGSTRGARTEACCACGGTDLHPHLSVAGGPGAEGLIPSTSAFGTALADIVRCQRCGHMQLSPMPSAARLDGAYAVAESEDYTNEERGQRATAAMALARMERHVDRAGMTGSPRLLDLGCWLGFLLDEARSRGWSVLGVEPSAFASEYARKRLGLEVHTVALLDLELEPSSFDAIVLGDVIEHLPDPVGALRRLAGLGRPGAVLDLALPDAGSAVARTLGRRWWSVIPTHVQYFTRGSIEVALRRGGWDTVELATAPKAFTVGYYLGRIEGYSRPLGRALVAGASRIGIAERMVAPDFRDRMAVVARLASED